jgi:endoglucanase
MNDQTLKHAVRIIALVLVIFVSAQSAVMVNQVGYCTKAQKIFYTTTPADTFFVVDHSSGLKVFSGTIKLSKNTDPASGQTIYTGDFSSFIQQGQFYIVTTAPDTSVLFTISDTVFQNVFRKSLKGFYFQRCGTALTPEFAGVYAHRACHLADGVFHNSSDTIGTRVTTGGWHDAGDYGKYVVNAGVTVGTLLMAYELFPTKFSCDNIGIPESGNGIPDILDEVHYELQWLLTMQRWDGGVYNKLTREHFEGFVMPEADTTAPRFLYQITTPATGDFAAMCARAARIYKPFNPQFADSCLAAARLAWNYLLAHPFLLPSGGYTNPPGTNTGAYGESDDSDERLWAAAELFSTTGEKHYHSYYTASYSSVALISKTMSWPDVRTLAHLTYLYTKQPSTNKTIQMELRNSLLGFASTISKIITNEGWNISLKYDEYGWGGTSEVLNRAILLILASRETNNKTFRNNALFQLNYILGANINNISFVTGIGTLRPMHVHHRPSGADGIVEPVPGLLVGGPDQNREDAVLQKRYAVTSPHAICYADDEKSYASNEICINWNAPLVFVAGYFSTDDFTAPLFERKK